MDFLSLAVAWVDLQRLLQLGSGFVRIVGHLEGFAQMVVESGVLRIGQRVFCLLLISARLQNGA